MAPPPGGEIDRTNPYVIGSHPQNGATNVAPDNRVTFFFSERVAKPQKEMQFFIAPRPEQPPLISWKSDRVELLFADSFASDQTYIISLIADLKDLRGNRLDSSAMIAFSTGTKIDSGIVSGKLWSGDKPQTGFLAALYDPDLISDSTTYDSLYPDYISQTTSGGNFSFEYLPPRQYRLILFADKNNDQRFNPWRERFAVADRRIDLSVKTAINDLDLAVTDQDSTHAKIMTVAYISDRLLKVRLTKPVEIGYIGQHPESAQLVSSDDSSLRINAIAVREAEKDSASLLHFAFGEIEPGEYDFELALDNSSDILDYRLLIPEIEDKTRPVLIEFTPSSSVAQFMQDLKISALFSEPISPEKITDQTFSLLRDSTRQLELSWEWVSPFRVEFKSDDIRPGERYHLTMVQFEIADMAGNLLGDSLQERFLSTLSSDSLGSVTGGVEVDSQLTGGLVVLTFRNFATGAKLTTTSTMGKFRIELPAGKYQLSGFIDRDDNQLRSLGSIYPFKLAETFARFPDTVKVRARFETAGLNFVFK